MMTRPNDLELLHQRAKPGHWSTATIGMISRREDFRGDLAVGPMRLADVPYQLQTRRPVLLPKGQRKELEITFLTPPGVQPAAGPPLDTRLLTGGTSRAVLEEANRIQPLLAAHQFYWLVLSDDAARYKFLAALPALSNTTFAEDASRTNTTAYYDLLLPRIERRVPLAGNPLTWTSLAVILWDEFDPGKLTPSQQQALLDWLHWGGQLIISGPGSLDRLRGGFLEPYLPAVSQGALELGTDQLAVLDRGWSLPGETLTMARPWSGLSLVPKLASETLVTSEEQPLVVERRVGRGRVVVSAFALNQRELIAWSGVNGFLENVLLRRPKLVSRHTPGDEGKPHVAGRFDPRRISRVRILSRDSGTDNELRWASCGLRASQDATIGHDFEGEFWDEQNRPLVGPGVCGWNDFSRLSRAAREVLRGAARIDVPKAAFVARMLAVYLIVLVPLNWIFFRLLGRVEWAWIAAPVIAVLFTVIVVRAAQLDIGFVRARTEVDVLELYADYARAHVTRYTALYTSLSTTYEVRYDDPTSLAIPFSTGAADLRFQRQGLITLQPGRPTRLGGFAVSSNSAATLHSEQTTILAGPVRLRKTRRGRWQVVNQTGLPFEGAAVVTADQFAWIGRLNSGGGATLNFEPLGDQTRPEAMHVRLAENRPSDERHEALDVRPMIEAAARLDREDAGQWRLVAWSKTPIGGMHVNPRASQIHGATVVVAHLKPAALPRVISPSAAPRD